MNENTPRCGTPNFIAPEIISGNSYDTKSDIFSLGVVLYYALSGILPFYSSETDVITRKTV